MQVGEAQRAVLKEYTFNPLSSVIGTTILNTQGPQQGEKVCERLREKSAIVNTTKEQSASADSSENKQLSAQALTGEI